MRALWLVSYLVLFGFIGKAEAHFKLNSPTSVTQQDASGHPQKAEPCGGSGTPTNMVTPVQSGSMLSISITETTYHPGHYRVALAQDMTGLPAAPTVTNANCNGLVPSANPTMPVLADGLLRHTSAFSNPTQTMQVPIPAGMTCTNCVLQIIQYMAMHGQPCFYYHCARVNISPDAPPPPPPSDGGIDPGTDAGTDGGGGGGGGGCSAGGEPVGGLLGGLVVGLLLRRRRR